MSEQRTSDKRVTHMLKRFGQSVTLCPLIPKNRAPIVTNDPLKVTCKPCKRLWAKGEM